MSEYQTIARPYAQAVFELAQADKDYQAWSDMLALAAAVAADNQVQDLARNPRVDRAALVALFTDLCGATLFPAAENFLRLLVSNQRVYALPWIATQFESMRAEAEGTIEAELVSAAAVSDQQQRKIAESLSRRLGRRVTLRVSQNPNLLGGAVLTAGDLVIDSSIRGRLQKLAASLSR